jgi:hypothetical protein
MPWTETRPTIYERPIGENENFIKLVGDRAHPLGREHWSVTSSATFILQKTSDETELTRQCREAWIALRFEHPSIASRAEGENLVYNVPDGDSLEAWADESFIVPEAGTSMDDLVASLRPSRYVQAYLLLPKPSIVLHFAHWRTDGYGALHLINAYLEQLSAVIDGKQNGTNDLKWGEELCRLVPSLEEVLDLPAESAPEVIATAQKYMATAALHRGAVGLKTSDGVEPTTVPRGTRSTRLNLTPAETHAVKEACKARNISVDAAVHACCAAVTYSGAAKDARDKPYTSTMRFTLRPHLPGPYGGAEFAAALYTGGYMKQVPAHQSWAENAAQYNKEYEGGITPEFLQSRRQYAKDILKVLQQVPPVPMPVTTEVDISSVGDAEKLVHPLHSGLSGEVVLEVSDVSVGVETLSRQIYCFFWLFRGQLELSLVWNESFYDAARVSQLALQLKTTLISELGNS